MRWKTYGKIIFALCVAAVVVFWVWVLIHPSFHACVNQAENTYREQHYSAGDRPFGYVPSLVGYGSCANAVAIHEGNAISALSTALLTFITIGLVILGYEQLLTTRAQLRAYVFMTKADVDQISTPNGAAVRASLQIENTGQTPAYDVRISAYWRYECGSVAMDFRKDTLGDQTIAIAPGHHVPTIAFVKGKAIPKAPPGEEPKFFVIGRVDYRDIFRRKQWTNIRCEVRKDGSSGQDNLHPCPEGNDAS